MHIPDGFLSNQVNLSFIAGSIFVGSFALKKVKDSLFCKTKVFSGQLATNVGLNIDQGQLNFSLQDQANKKIQKMALIAAFIFAAQMINFPVGNGTSGHLIGGVLASVILGPWAGMLMVSAVLAVQALVFGDGGIIVMGANIFNMGIVAAVGGYYIYFFLNKLTKNKYLPIFFASFFSVLLAAISCSIQLALAGTIKLSLVMPNMVSIHILIGLGEALITILAIKFLFKELYEQEK